MHPLYVQWMLYTILKLVDRIKYYLNNPGNSNFVLKRKMRQNETSMKISVIYYTSTLPRMNAVHHLERG